MNTPDSVRMARPVIAALRRAGAEVVLIQYWSRDGFPVDDLGDPGVSFLTISDHAFDSIPRLSLRQYRDLCGDDIDFHRCQGHSIMAEDYPLTRDHLFQDSAHHQRFHGMALRIEALLRAVAPDAVLLQQGSEPISKFVAAKSAKLGIPFLVMETSFFPGRILLDPCGMHFFPGQNRIDRMWPDVRGRAITTEERERLNACLDAWRKDGTSKYAQKESAAEVEALDRFVSGRKNILFAPDQIRFDANVLNGLALFPSLAAMFEAVERALPDDWAMVRKIHPKNPEAADEAIGAVAPNLFVTRNVSIHRLFDLARTVLVFSSNVGLEALFLGKPVITCGRPHYGGKGLTLDLDAADRLPELIRKSLDFTLDGPLRERFLHHVLFEYLLDPNDTPAVMARVAEAGRPGTIETRPADLGATGAAPAGPPAVPLSEAERRAPWSGHGSARLADWLELARRYNALADRNHDHREILERVGPDARERGFAVPEAETDAGELGSGERQVAPLLELVAPDHLLRYGFAAALARPGGRILDFGCGIGYGTSVLARTPDSRVTGVDASRGAIAYARQHWSAPNIEYVEASSAGFEPADAGFDLVVSFEIVEHVPNDRAFLDRMWGMLRPGGTLLFSVPDQDGYPIAGHPFHIRHYSETSLNRLLDGLPGVEFRRLLGQDRGGRIDQGISGTQWIVVAGKSPAGGIAPASPPRDRDSITEDMVTNLLPFSRLPVDDRDSGVLRFAAWQFQTQGGVRNEGYLVSDPERTDCYFIYGPYTKLPAGNYTAQFQLVLRGDATGMEAGVLLDVAAAGGRVLQEGTLGAAELNALRGCVRAVSLPFRHGGGTGEVEFRIQLRGRPFSGRLEFHGVEIRRDPGG